MAFITPPLERYSAKVSCRSKLAVVEDVYEKLDEEHRKLFLESAFGKLYEMRENMNPSNVLLHALVMLRIESPDPNEVWFCIGGQRVRFGLPEYTLITGLYSGDEADYTKDIPPTNRLFNEYFEGRKKAVKPKELNEAFSNAKSELDRYKLGLAVIYESVLRAKERSTSIDTGVLNIVDNLELFNMYPWGRRSYPNLLPSLKKLSNKDGVKTNTFYGFPFAIQVWAFESFGDLPGFRDIYQLEKIGTVVPRMCNWKSTENPSYEEIIEILDTQHDVALGPLVPNDAESCLPYVHGFPGTWCTTYIYNLEEQPAQIEFAAQRRSPHCDQPEVEVGVSSSPPPPRRGDASRVAPENDLMRLIFDVVTSMQQQLTDNFLEINRKIDDHSIQIKKIDDHMIEMNQKINELVEARREQTPSHQETMMTPPHQETMMGTTAVLLNTAMEQNRTNVVNTASGKTKETEQTGDTTDEQVEATAKTTDEDTEHTRDTVDEDDALEPKKKRKRKEIDSANILITGRERAKKPSAQVITPFTTESRVADDPIIPGLQFHRTFVDGRRPQLFLKADPLKYKLFTGWLKKAKKSDFVMRHDTKVVKEWLRVYIKPREFLLDSHMDLALLLMRERQQKYPLTFGKNNRAILDTGFIHVLVLEYRLYEENPQNYVMPDALMDFANGTWKKFGKPWAGCERIYFPVEANQHWIVVDLELRTGKLTVYDPDRSCLTMDQLRKALTPYTFFIPKIGEKAGIEIGTITIDRDTVTEKMGLSGDCGIYSLKYIEFLSIDESPYGVTAEHIENWRLKFAVDIFCANNDP